MEFEQLFIDGHNLPMPLSKEEVYDLLEKTAQGDEQAREKLIKHNIRLVLYEVTVRFKSVEYDKKDLVSIGNIGLMKAIETFDKSRNLEFSTYATRCIENEILMFLRKLKKDRNVDSLNMPIGYSKDGDKLKIEDTLSDNTDIVKEYLDKEMHLIIRQIVNNLPEFDREIIMLYFGFYNDKTYTQKEIADILSISQKHVSTLIRKIVERLGKQLEQKGLIQLRTVQRLKGKTKIKEEKNPRARKLQTIYEYFSLYTKEEVDTMLEKLSEEEKALIILRYGEDLNNPVSGKLSKEQTYKFYSCLIPKMKRLIANPNKKRVTKIKKKKYL